MNNKFLLSILISTIWFSCSDLNLSVATNKINFIDSVKSNNGAPIANAIISIHGGDIRFSTMSDKDGNFNLEVEYDVLPQVGYISLNISHPDYRPQIIVYKAPLIGGNAYNSNGQSQNLITCPNCLQIYNSNYTELFHLGDDNYGGEINSQFQKTTDGLNVTFDFDNSLESDSLLLIFHAKGVQPDQFEVPSAVIFGDNMYETIITKSPTDGSYAEYAIKVKNAEDINSFTLQTSDKKVSNCDYDDWEFSSLFLEAF